MSALEIQKSGEDTDGPKPLEAKIDKNARQGPKTSSQSMRKKLHTQHARLQKVNVSIVALTALASELKQRVATVDDGKEFNSPSFFRP